MKNVAIIGGTGYGALELIRFIQFHEHLQLKMVISQSHEGEYLDTLYPHLVRYIEKPLESLDLTNLKNEIDIVFLATPAGVSKELTPQLEGTSIQCIDLSGDLRLTSPEQYTKWYGKEAAPQATLNKAVYGLSDIYHEKVKQAKVIANPGCFPTSILLGLIPAIRNELIDTNSIIIDGKTGVSGAGKTLSPMTHFSETNENVKPYKIGQHQHIPEIEQYLSEEANKQVNVSFTTHLIPMTRGLLCTMYAKLTSSIEMKDVLKIYEQFYESSPFVRIRKTGSFPETKQVYASNYCDIGIYVDSRTNQLIVMSVIDNLVKGAAGQAIQNVNLMNGWEEDHGLNSIPVYP